MRMNCGTGRTRRLLTIGLALVGAGMAVACAEEIRSDEPTEASERTPIGVRAAAVDESTDELSERHRFQTHLYSERDAQLYNRLMIEETAGGGIPVTAIHVEVGDRVRGGQLLATLEDSDARLYVAAAEPEAEVAESDLLRIEELRKTGAVSEAEYEQAVYRHRTAAAALEQARLHLSRTQIRAPFSGIVSRRYVRVGDVVDNETPLFRVTDMAPLRARLLVPEEEIESFAIASPVELTAVDGTKGMAQVIIVGPTADPGSGTREVIVELSDVGEFRPGASVTARLEDPPTP